MNFHLIVRKDRINHLPLLESARLQGRPTAWPSEKLERLLTPCELDQVLHGQL